MKPTCKLLGEDGNIFVLLSLASKTLKKNGMKEEAAEMTTRVMESGSYDKALMIISDYVEIE